MKRDYVNEVIKVWKILAEIDPVVNDDVSPQVRHNNRRFLAEHQVTGVIRERTLIQMRNHMEPVDKQYRLRGEDHTGYKSDIISVIGRTIKDGVPYSQNGRPMFDCTLGQSQRIVILNRTQISKWIEGSFSLPHRARSVDASDDERIMYSMWQILKHRIRNTSHKGYKTLGALGYTISDEWADSFSDFSNDILNEIGPRNSKYFCLYPVNGKNFCKGNVQWFHRKSLRQTVYK